eukprot:134547-Amphidinium_carterae.2
MVWQTALVVWDDVQDAAEVVTQPVRKVESKTPPPAAGLGGACVQEPALSALPRGRVPNAPATTTSATQMLRQQVPTSRSIRSRCPQAERLATEQPPKRDLASKRAGCAAIPIASQRCSLCNLYSDMLAVAQ